MSVPKSNPSAAVTAGSGSRNRVLDLTTELGKPYPPTKGIESMTFMAGKQCRPAIQSVRANLIGRLVVEIAIKELKRKRKTSVVRATIDDAFRALAKDRFGDEWDSPSAGNAPIVKGIKECESVTVQF